MLDVATEAWSPSGTILVGTVGKVMQQVSEKGGVLSPLTPLDTSREEMSQRWPRFLPDGRHFLYLSSSRKEGRSAIFAGSLDSREIRRITDGDSNSDYSGSGHLVFVRDGHLTAQAFDANRLQVTGDAFPLTDETWWSNMGAGALFSISNNGTLVLASAGIQNTQLVWFDRGGRRLGALGTAGEHVHLDLSPDDSHVAFERLDPTTGMGQIWLLDVGRLITSRFSLVPSFELYPCWSPDGKRVASSSSRAGVGTTLYQQAATGAGEDEPLRGPGLFLEIKTDWTPDGRYVLIQGRSKVTGLDLWALPLEGDRKPFPLIETPFDEVRELIVSAPTSVARGVDLVQVHTNFEIGRRIVEQEQKGKGRAAYGKEAIKALAETLTAEFGSGFLARHLAYARTLYPAYRLMTVL